MTTYEEFAGSRLHGLLRYAVMLTGDPHLAQDLVQDTMVKIQLRWRQVSRAESPDRYAQKMITNAYIDARRGSWLRRVVLKANPTEPPAVPDHAIAAAQRDEVWRWLARLPKQQRAALVLRYYEGLSDGDSAEILGCAVGTVRASISRALATLRIEVVDASARTSPLRPMEARGV